MSTGITDVYNGLVSLIEANLTSYKKIPNPYFLDDNASILLTKGYGIGYGAGSNTERQLGCRMWVARTFTIALINQVVSRENDTTTKANLEKSILEDLITLIIKIEQDPTISANTTKAKYVSDSGIQFLEAPKKKYLYLELDIEVEYFENI